ncbi:Phosphatidylinositol 3 [Ceratocystis lukuohia]|uniref:Phosphatidylinositol 3-kinase VPS34 n=1 Tax=Ceratocystis lukuohia TaxID=2019550 RepID=A0ABR4MIZ3_9PEZI
MDPFSFATSPSLDFDLKIRIINLEGDEPAPSFSQLLHDDELRHTGSHISPHSDLYVIVQVFAGSKALVVPMQTSYKAFKTERRWNEWLTLPIKFKDLPSNAQLAITLWDHACALPSPTPTSTDDSSNRPSNAVPFGGTTFRLFDKDNQMHQGRQKCFVHRRVEADGNDVTKTPSSPPKETIKTGELALDKEAEEMSRIEALFKRHEMSELAQVNWLDQLVFRGYEKKMAAHHAKVIQLKKMGLTESNGPDKSSPARFYLNIELARFDFPIVFADHEYAPPPMISPHYFNGSQSQQVLRRPPPQVQFGPGISHGIGNNSAEAVAGPLFKVYDAEIGRDNPVESKHRRLFRSAHRNGILDKDLKPNAKVRDELNAILSYPPTHVLSPEQSDLVWKFRYHLTRDKRALTKFVKSVNWLEATEVKQAEQLLSRWTEIDVDDALELFGPSFESPIVRAFAVERLRKAEDAELQLYLLQLVQALKYEHILDSPPASAVASSPATEESATAKDSSLATFLISRAAANFQLGNYFYWYLMVECDDNSPEQGETNRNIYRKVAYDFMAKLVQEPEGTNQRQQLRRQAELITILSKISTEVKLSNETIARKVDRVKVFLADPKNELLEIKPPLPLPLDPSILITGVVPEETTVFKSSLCPIKVTFATHNGPNYSIIFKTGDDLRQDQLVIQIITLMDQLLQKENVDLKLSPYKILATSASAGASQFVASTTFQSIASRYRTNPALEYLREQQPDVSTPLKIRNDTLETYMRSCAGYCVITYILGVGDRHLDNLLLAPDGHFFHADFGFILGRDPKPFAPVMKLSKEMVDCMGGTTSENYKQFKQYCFLAYTALRKQSNLILNLFSLMVDANIPDIRLEPDKAVLKVRERFHLDLSEEEAIRTMDRIIEGSLGSIAPMVIDKLHELVQAFRT